MLDTFTALDFIWTLWLWWNCIIEIEFNISIMQKLNFENVSSLNIEVLDEILISTVIPKFTNLNRAAGGSAGLYPKGSDLELVQERTGDTRQNMRK